MRNAFTCENSIFDLNGFRIKILIMQIKIEELEKRWKEQFIEIEFCNCPNILIFYSVEYDNRNTRTNSFYEEEEKRLDPFPRPV